MHHNITCDNRNEFIKKITKDINANASNFYFFLGKNGTGKEYVLTQIENLIKKDFKIYRITSDIIMEKNKNVFSHTFDFSFSLSAFAGISLSMSKNTNTKINYIVSHLKSFSLKKKIIISAINYEELSAESRDFIFVLISNKKIIEEKTRKKITVILTGVQNYFYGRFNAINVKFNDYSKKDLYSYLTNVLCYTVDVLSEDIINQIYKLCGTNFNLVNSYCDYIINHTNCNYSIEAILDLKLNYYIFYGKKYNLSKEELEKIIFTSSNSIKNLTPQMIGYINNENDEICELGFESALENYLLEKETKSNAYETQNYYFISEQEKNIISKKYIQNHTNTIMQFYIYMTLAYEDEYFERAQFLYKYFKILNKEIFSLLVLALSKTYLFNDYLIRDEIEKFILSKDNTTQLYELFIKIKNAYYQHYKTNYIESYYILENLNFSLFHPVLKAELRRLQFKNMQLGRIKRGREIFDLVNQLKTYIEKELLILLDNKNFKSKEEKLLTLRIIYEISPYFLDVMNDKDNFNYLYDKSLLIVNFINQNFIKKSYADFILNIFNRKAFLFAPPPIALLYYEEAEAYFRENKIIEELIMTLASKAGINMALNMYDKAISNCEEALKIAKDYNIKLPQEEKIYNNLYISKFLDYEQSDVSDVKINEYAHETIINLKNIVNDENNSINHVVLTNLASMYLYVNDENNYILTKRKLEKLLNCTDVSNIKDITINDFYRYHFAWFEFYRLLCVKNKKECKRILNDLNGFYPSIFHEYTKIDLRVKAASNLLTLKELPTIKEYCLKFLEYSQQSQGYKSRGLLLSDLQFTSWE